MLFLSVQNIYMSNCQVSSLKTYNTVSKVSVFGVFLVRIFLHLEDYIRTDTEHISVFSANEGKYRSEKREVRTLLT